MAQQVKGVSVRQEIQEMQVPSWDGKILSRRARQLAPVFLPGESLEQAIVNAVSESWA